MNKILLILTVAIITTGCSSTGSITRNNDGSVKEQVYASKDAQMAALMGANVAACYASITKKAEARLQELMKNGNLKEGSYSIFPHNHRGDDHALTTVAEMGDRANDRIAQITEKLIDNNHELEMAKLGMVPAKYKDSCAGLGFANYKLEVKRINSDRLDAVLDFGGKLVWPIATVVGGVLFAHEVGTHAQGDTNVIRRTTNN